MSDMKFGNIWHGRLSAAGLTPEGGAEITAVTANNGAGGTTTFNYISPAMLENIGHTYYYKQPAIAEVTTPTLISAAGGAFKNDAILFGNLRRYSAFGGGGLLGERCWLHWGSDGKWRKMSLGIVSTGDGSAPVISITRHEQFGLINKAAPYEATQLAEITLSGKTVSDPQMSEIDVRHDGRQVVIHLRGKWTNMTDPGAASLPSTQTVPFDNSAQRAIAAAWSITISDDCASASATRVWLAENPTPTIQHWGHWETVGPVFVSPLYPYSDPVAKYYQRVRGAHSVSPNISWVAERLVGIGFDRFGALHLVKYKYSSDVVGAWGELLSGATAVGFSATDVLDLTPYNTPNAEGFYEAPPIAPEYNTGVPETSSELHPQQVSFSISIESGGVTLKTFSSPLDPPPHAVMKTNNASDFRQPSQSICRLAAGCIEDFTISGTGEFVFVAFNPRAGTVHSSSSPIGFV